MTNNNKRVTWYECDCDWITNHCEENHQRSMTIGEIKAEALEEFAAELDRERLHWCGPETVQDAILLLGDRADEYRLGAQA